MDKLLVLMGIVLALSAVVYLAFVKLPQMGNDKKSGDTPAVSLGCASCSNTGCMGCELAPAKTGNEVRLSGSSGSRDLNILDSEEVKLR